MARSSASSAKHDASLSDPRRRSAETAGCSSGTSVAPADSLRVCWSEVVAAVALLWAGWIACDCVGLIGRPLRSVLLWLALLSAVIAGRPPGRPGVRRWLYLLAAGLTAVVWIALGKEVAGALGVVLVGTSLVHLQPRGAGRQGIFCAVSAVAAMALFELARTSLPGLWRLSDAVGGWLGSLAGLLCAQPLNIGATFGALCVLVSMAVFVAAWLMLGPPFRWQRAFLAVAAVVFAHAAYLLVLAHAHLLLAALPEYVYPSPSDNDLLGIWTWGNLLHSLLPWDLPAAAALVHAMVAAAMLRMMRYPSKATSPDATPARAHAPVTAEQQPDASPAADLPGGASSRFRLLLEVLDRHAAWATGLLAVCWALAGALTPGRVDLAHKTIVAYEQGYLNWLKPQHGRYYSEGSHLYGVLPDFIASLGGKLVHSEELSAEDLGRADMVLLIHPDRPWPEDRLRRLLDYVRRGGSLLLVAEPRVFDGDSRSSFPELLSHTALQVRDDTALGPADYWEDNLQLAVHPLTVGLGKCAEQFGMLVPSSIQLQPGARPLVVGRYGISEPGSDAAVNGTFSFEGGERLGDLVLAAEQRFGEGRVVVLGDTTPLCCEGLAGAWQFIGRTLGYLACRSSDPRTLWRQVLGVFCALGLFVLLLWRPRAEKLAVLAVALPATLGTAGLVTCWSWRVLPDGTRSQPNNLAFVDASHQEAYSHDPWNSLGLGSFLRTLARNGYLPLKLYDEPFGLDGLWGQRIERAGLLVCIGPSQRFSGHERRAVRKMLDSGGTLICMCGAERAGATNELLSEYGLKVPPAPLPPVLPAHEPEPMGSVLAPFLVQGETIHYLQTYAAWPVQAEGYHWKALATGREGQPVVLGQPAPDENGPGQVVLVGDTLVAVNENVQTPEQQAPANEDFWRWLIGQVTPHPEWIPPDADAQGAAASGSASPGRPAGPQAEQPSKPAELPAPPGQPEPPEPETGLELPEPQGSPELPEPPSPLQPPAEPTPEKAAPQTPPERKPPDDPYALPDELPGEWGPEAEGSSSGPKGARESGDQERMPQSNKEVEP